MSAKKREEVIDVEENGSENLNLNASTESMRILEALLFASEELLTANKIKSILPDNPDVRKIRKMVDNINAQLQKERHPFEIVEIGGGYQFRTVSYYHPWVRQIFKEKAAKKLSIQALECLAIIAYKQPISKAEIEAVRGVVSDGAMKTLLERRLVTIAGRSDKPGRPLLYSTTNEFLKYFGLNKLEELPKIEEFEAIAREKVEELSMEELQNENDQDSDTDSENDSLVNEEENRTDSVQDQNGSEEISEKESDVNEQAEALEELNQNVEENEQSSEKTEQQSQQNENIETDSDNDETDTESIDKDATEESGWSVPETSETADEPEPQNVPDPESTAVFEVDFAETEEKNSTSDNMQEKVQDSQEDVWDTQEFDEKIREAEDDYEQFIRQGSQEITDEENALEEQDETGRNEDIDNVSDELESSDEDEYMEETAEINKETIRMDALSGRTGQAESANDTEEEEEEEVLEVFLTEPQNDVSDSDPEKEDDSSKKKR